MKKRTIFTAIGIVAGSPLLLILGGMTWYAVYDRTSGNIVSLGETRDYLLYVPESYDPTVPAPLVISMHGTALWPAIHRDVTHWNTLADKHGFIVLYPGAGGRPLRKWQLEQPPGPGVAREVQFISDLVDSLEDAYRIDTARIYADGLSAGGSVAIVLACRMSDRIAAFGTVVAPPLLNDSCDVPQPVPLMAFNGTADRLVPYHGGVSWAVSVPMPSVSDWIASWAKRNHCAPTPIETQESADVLRRAYEDCTEDLVHYTLEGGGHQWPGGTPFPAFMAGPPIDSIDATSTLWEFFAEHRLEPE